MDERAEHIPFNQPFVTGRELAYITEAIEGRHLSGNGPFARRCTDWLETSTAVRRALLTPSCTDALEMMAILGDLGPGDEVIMPSFTFVSTANAVVLRGAVPVFVDIRPDTLNIDERQIEEAITERTKAVMAVHYAGVACEMDEIVAIANRHDLLVFEDAAQGILSTYRGRPLGSLGDAAALSFHETKNVMCGEGGALLVGREDWVDRAEVVHEKGTDRSRFFRGEVDKYSWRDVGSSYVLSEINSAFLWGQLEHAAEITGGRLETWDRYHEAFAELEASGALRRPIVPDDRTHNAHMYYVLLRGERDRDAVLEELNARGVSAMFHYVPLHTSDAGRKFGRASGDLPVTCYVSESLIRLPLYAGVETEVVDRVVDEVHDVLRVRVGAR
jgi:dTDP-4-amino-4,6-dideoxygalactose transaminase